MAQSVLTRVVFIFVCVVFFGPLLITQPGYGSLEGEIVGGWAETFGEELWDLGQRITKAPEIKLRYKALNARVEIKDGESLIKSIVENVGRMLMRKMDAVKCILAVAEAAAEQFGPNDTDANLTYYSTKYSQVEGQPPPEIPETMQEDAWMYRSMYLNPDTHFYNIPVNTAYSGVHIPTNVYDRRPLVQEAIQWSEALDEVFVQNYNSDPALSWQYFGDSTGMLRQYPAMMWKQDTVDLFDCRTRSWYIEAATCSKDVVILLDNSGSMRGFRNYIARLTVRSILETFSNNDFVNIYNFSKTIQEVVPCFKDMLVQATPENIHIFNDAVQGLDPEGNANVTLAFIKAFQLLEEYRINRGCHVVGRDSGCNQAIMLVTDGVPGNITEVFEQYNWFDNGTRIPVRVFTYLIGKEVTKVREIHWMACLNRGYYTHIRSLDEVQQQVLKYISVIARPLVLQGVDHPVSWTHAYADITDEDSLTSQDNVVYQEYRLLTSVAIPAFDKKANRGPDGNFTKAARLLGVAGTDVPISDIDKLTLPYKLGVNGYSFVVSNNGYLLLHPDLRPVYQGYLKENYNSIDLSEVEMVDDGREARDPSPLILDLREALVNHSSGKMAALPVRYHYDDMRRVSRELQDYYYAPLPNTPFSLGLVLPSQYGSTWIKVGDEIKRNQHMGVNISDFFIGDNWKVHPEWVYCKYHYLEGHEFSNPEEELLHFLVKLGRPDWRWAQQYEPEAHNEPPDEKRTSGRDDNGADSDEDGIVEEELNCGRKTLADDDYYCNKELVQLLIFDAKVTDPSYKSWSFRDEVERDLFVRYNASLRFVATMSGLTRWQFVFGEDMNDTSSEFGDYHTRAIDETWYKSAVLQHQIDPNSFVFSVPLGLGANQEVPEGRVVTASHAIFPRDGGLEAPGSVVGFQFSHDKLYKRFMEITSKAECDGCLKTCASEEQDCFVIDNNGYVILSETLNDTGMFFGELEGAVMEAMVEADIFQKVPVFDLQGLCFINVMVSSDCPLVSNPFRYLQWLIQWLIGRLIWIATEAAIWTNAIALEEVYDYENLDPVGPTGGAPPTAPPRKLRKGENMEEEEFFSRPRIPKWERRPFACDRQSDLFLLMQDMFIKGDGYVSEAPTNCSRPFFVKRIPHSNLLLVVVNTMHPSCYRVLSASPRDIEYHNGTEPPCHKLGLNYLPRRRLEGCYTEHPLEDEVDECGGCNALKITFTVFVISWSTLVLLNNAH